MTDNTTRVIKLANGESIVCTCIPTRTDEASTKLHVVHPLKMELKSRITKQGIVEALSLSRWLQPFTESDEFDIEKSTIITVTPASYALNNYYQTMLNSFSAADAEASEPIVQRVKEENEEDEFENSEEIRQMFKQYVSALSGDNKEKEIIKEEVSEEDLDNMITSNDTKH
tara:strand:+ start:3110 stop:3622 length:513 start_codon:yes stop_codon:yes gene_type:complete